MKFKYVLFDLDGTLIDTNKLIMDSFKHTYKKHLDIEVEEQEILQYFGEPLMTTLARYDKDHVQQLFKTYIDYNETMHDGSVKLFENIRECLEALREEGCSLAVVTSKRSVMAHRGLRLFDILKYFDVVVTVDDTANHKPHPEPILKALEKLGAKPEEALMIGDSVFDILCAHHAGIKGAYVGWGTALAHQQAEKPDYMVQNAMEIVEIVKG
jgi:pyrophosphatase PpaX